MRWKKRAGRSFGIILAFALAAAVGVPMLAWADEGTENAAKIGEKEYPTLAAAAKEAKAGDTVELLTNHRTTDIVVFEAPVTLDLCNHTLTIGDAGYLFGICFEGVGENKLENGIVTDERGEVYSNSLEWLTVFSLANLSTENVTIEGHRSNESTATNYLLRMNAYDGSSDDTVLNLGSGTVLEIDAPPVLAKNASPGVALTVTRMPRSTTLLTLQMTPPQTPGICDRRSRQLAWHEDHHKRRHHHEH